MPGANFLLASISERAEALVAVFETNLNSPLECDKKKLSLKPNCCEIFNNVSSLLLTYSKAYSLRRVTNGKTKPRSAS